LAARSGNPLAPLAVVAAFGAIWWIAARGSVIVPTPWDVVTGTVELARSGLLLKHIAASLMRVAVGFGLAAALAIPLGVLMGWFAKVHGALNPLVQMLRPISPIAWIPLAIVWFGVGNLAPIFLIFLASFFPMVVQTAAGIERVEPEFIRAGRNYGFRGLRFFRQVVIPAALPDIVVGVRVALGVAWLVVVAGEMVAINSGLGYLIIDARNAGNRYDLVVAGMVAIGVIGFLLDTLTRRLERMDEVRWRYGR
jgi:NitT/TauT family transport system permease protein